MAKSYQLKWFFILTGILTVSSLLLRQRSFNDASFPAYLDYCFRLSTTILAGWLIHGYFLLHKFTVLTDYTKHFVSNILVIISFLIITNLQFLLLPFNPLIEEHSFSFEVINFMHHLTRAFFLSIICYLVFYNLNANSALQSSKLENEILEQAHLRAQLLSLQQQISPHFLFNSLSTLKTIANDQPTKNYIVQLSSVYRYLLKFNDRHTTELGEELAFIKSYLYIMSQRFEDALQLDIQISDRHLKLHIPPLSLQLLVENAIKHNKISPEQPLHIKIITDDSPAIIVENNFQPKEMPEEGTSTGLKNISERYKLLANLSIQVLNNGSKFSVTLPLLKP